MLPEFLNVDLELESEESLDLIAQEFGNKVHILHNGPLQGIKYLLALEVYDGDDHDPDSIITVFCDLIGDLSAKSKALWRRAKARRFDIGIESGTAETKKFKALCLSLRPETLKRISALNAEALITVYSPPSAPEKVVKAKSKAKVAPKAKAKVKAKKK